MRSSLAPIRRVPIRAILVDDIHLGRKISAQDRSRRVAARPQDANEIIEKSTRLGTLGQPRDPQFLLGQILSNDEASESNRILEPAYQPQIAGIPAAAGTFGSQGQQFTSPRLRDTQGPNPIDAPSSAEPCSGITAHGQRPRSTRRVRL